MQVAPEWAAACLDSAADSAANSAISANNTSAATDASDMDHCAATAYAAAVACTGAKPAAAVDVMTSATRACAAALSSLASPVCAAAHARCVAGTADALACSPSCGASLSAVSRHCGGFMLRAEHGTHSHVASEACSDAVRSAQDGCGGASDAACLSLLEAVPAEEHHSVHDDDTAASGASPRAQVHHRRATLWGGQHARGVVPTKHLCGGLGHLDLRDNVLLGSVPVCAWALEAGPDEKCLPRHHPYFTPSFLDVISII